MASYMRAFNLSKQVDEWLDKKKKESVNLSAFVTRLLEEAMIKELESQ